LGGFDALIIGSGPSLTGFDFTRLPPAVRFGANKSAWLADCDVFVTIDHNFHRNMRAEIEAFTGERIVARAQDEHIPGVTYVKHGRGELLSDDPEILHGYNSGYAAMNLAYQRGYKRIGLLGFDFKWTDGRSHFHDGYAWQNKDTPKYLSRWVVAFDRCLPQLAAKGVTVINFVGPKGSGITAFETRPLEDLLCA